MTRPKTIDDATILEVTRRLVAAQGLSVSTREIAAEAGISEAVLYQRFSSKHKLIEAALGFPELDTGAIFAAGAAADDAVTALERIALAILGEFRRIIPSVLPAIGDPTTGLRATLWAHDGPLLSCIFGLTDYLRREVELGRLYAEDPHTIAFLLVSALHSVVLFEALQGEQFDCDAQVRAIIKDVWNGLKPRSDPAKVRR
jgi:AcrR family transcriptional regulator